MAIETFAVIAVDGSEESFLFPVLETTSLLQARLCVEQLKRHSKASHTVVVYRGEESGTIPDTQLFLPSRSFQEYVHDLDRYLYFVQSDAYQVTYEAHKRWRK